MAEEQEGTPLRPAVELAAQSSELPELKPFPVLPELRSFSPAPRAPDSSSESPLMKWKTWGLQKLKIVKQSLSERLGNALPSVDRVSLCL